MSLSLLLFGAQTTLTPARPARVLAGVQESANKEGHVKLGGGCSTAEYGDGVHTYTEYRCMP